MSYCPLFHKMAGHLSHLFRNKPYKCNCFEKTKGSPEKIKFGKNPLRCFDAISIFQMLKLTVLCVPPPKACFFLLNFKYLCYNIFNERKDTFCNNKM